MLHRRMTKLLAGATPAVLSLVAAGAVRAQAEGGDLFPPNARPGECYARVFIPPTYSTETEQLLKREGSDRLEIVPERYEWVEEKVLVKEASERLEVIPATYGWVEERILVRPASKRIEEVAAVYETVTEQVVDRPAHTVWKKGTGLLQKVDHATGEVLCLVEVPATMKTVTRRVLKTPATTREIEIPAEYRTVRKQVQKTPPSTRTVRTPAEYSTVRTQKKVADSEVRRLPIPPEYQTVTHSRKVTEGRVEWKPVLCQTNANGEVVRSIQRSLETAGHDPGPIDGVLGRQTMEAISSFQRAKGLPTGALTLETLAALGVRLGA